MVRFSVATIAFALTFGLAAPSMAEPGGPDAPNGAESVGEDSALVKAAPALVSARAAVMVHSFRSDPTLALRRNKGFQAIRRLEAGVYCLKPIGSIKAKESVASVSVNWIASFGNNLQATIAAPSFQCAGKEFEVRTFQFAPGGDFLPSDEVSFTLVVP